MTESNSRKEQIKIAIVGYGNIGRGVHKAIEKNRELYGDMNLVGIITRRADQVANEVPGVSVYHSSDRKNWGDLEADVAILCGGSKADLPVQGPVFASYFNTVDSFDTHDHIHPYEDERGNYRLGYFKEMNNAARANNRVSIVSAGWDPGVFSLERVLFDAIIPGCVPGAFYGLTEKGGLSQGHSDAIRQIPGVKDARQYTHAIPEAIEKVRQGEADLTKGDMHWRECRVVLENDTPKERERVRKAIVNDPEYFAPYRTEVHFVEKGELSDDMPHDGIVVASGVTGEGNPAIMEYKNIWGSNPEATGSILVACARACHRLAKEVEAGKREPGAYTMLDIPVAYLSPRSQETLLEKFM